MAIWAIADLHLSFNENKPMDIFGDNWKNHEEKIKQDWLNKVSDNDLVLLPGDFSWSMHLEDTVKDFEYINQLPGKKILLKGNHDYWWTTVTKMRKFIEEHGFKNIDFLHNNSFEYEGVIIAGTKGWALSGEEYDEKLVQREMLRLELSIEDGIKKYGEDKEVIVCMHYPPTTKNGEMIFINIMKKYNIKQCLYGHLHSTAIQGAVEGDFYGIDLKLVSADGIDFKLLKVKD
ncbi:MAG: metallophosphoesterase [Clostridia bacterium]|nr:metallophosphoesterase [Clostridia bacterium]